MVAAKQPTKTQESGKRNLTGIKHFPSTLKEFRHYKKYAEKLSSI